MEIGGVKRTPSHCRRRSEERIYGFVPISVRFGVRRLDAAFDDEARLVTLETARRPMDERAGRQAGPSKAVSSHRTPSRSEDSRIFSDRSLYLTIGG